LPPPPAPAGPPAPPTGLHQGPEETGMEQLDPDDGLAVWDGEPVWDFKEASDAAGGNLASPSRVESLGVGCAARPGSSGIPASGARRAEDPFVTLTATWPPSPTGSSPWPAPSPGKASARTEAPNPNQRKEVNTMPRIIKPTMHHWDRGRPNRRMRSRRRDSDDRGRRHDRSRDRSW
jgi:hypothetical protein